MDAKVRELIEEPLKENNIKLIMCTVTPTIWPEQMNTAINKINENLKSILYIEI